MCKFLIDCYRRRHQGQSPGFAEASYKLLRALPTPTSQSQRQQRQRQDCTPAPKIKAAIWLLYQARKMLMAPEPLCLQEGDYRGKPTHGDKQVKGEPATQGHCLMGICLPHSNLGSRRRLFSAVAEWEYRSCALNRQAHGWRDSSAVRSMNCCCKQPEFGSQHLGQRAHIHL